MNINYVNDYIVKCGAAEVYLYQLGPSLKRYFTELCIAKNSRRATFNESLQ